VYVARIIWDMEDEPDGNVRHIAENDLTPEEVDSVLMNPKNSTEESRSSGEPITFGFTNTGRHIAVIWEHVHDDPLTVRPITAYETPPPRRKGR
jgi:hypothetical protein